MIIYNNKIKYFKSLNYGIVYFNEAYDDTKNMDIIQEYQYERKHLFSSKFFTLFIDLTRTEADIFSNFAKNTKYEINRAGKKDNIIIEILDPEEHKALFYKYYNDFAMTKNRPLINQGEIDLLIQNNMFTIRKASCDGEILAIHTYITSNNRSRLAHSVSLFRNYDDVSHRNLIGRANRLLHWEDIKYFKSKNYLLYDFGGINIDTSNEETNAINSFKKGFGGQIVKEYKSFVPVSIKGWIYLIYQKMIGNL